MVNELNAVVGELGGEAGVGRAIRTGEDLRNAIRDGLPHTAVDGLLRSAHLSLQELATSLDLSVRSLQRRNRVRWVELTTHKGWHAKKLKGFSRNSTHLYLFG